MISLSDIVSVNVLTLILEMIGQCEVQCEVTLCTYSDTGNDRSSVKSHDIQYR